MSKRIDQSKRLQGWRSSGPSCGNCSWFESELVENKTPHGIYVEEKKKRCSLGEFATGKMAWCEKHNFKETS